MSDVPSTPSFVPRHRISLPAAAVASATLLSACYQYAPTAGEPAPTAGTEVRLVLTDASAARLAGPLGGGVQALDGRIDVAVADSIVVRATGTVLRTGETRQWNGERVALARGDVASVQARRLSRPRTLLAVLGGVGIAIAAALGGRSAGGGDEGNRPPPETGK